MKRTYEAMTLSPPCVLDGRVPTLHDRQGLKRPAAGESSRRLKLKQPIQFPACAEEFKLEIRLKNRANGILLKIFDTAPVYHLSHGIFLSSIQCHIM
jgi:hypothetical protein